MNIGAVESPESCFDIIAREPVPGGQQSVAKEKLRVVLTEDGIARELTVLLKRTSATEGVALRAANEVPGASAIPRLIRSGRDSRGSWIAIPFYTGEPAPTETTIPDNVMDSLAAVHAHYLGTEPPEEIPIRGVEWWKAGCGLPRLREFGRPSLQPIIEAVQSWSTNRAMLDALTELPRTLLHGDVHRNNVVINGDDCHLIDWGGASYGIAHIDLITPGPPNSRGYERYGASWLALTGETTTSLRWRRSYLTATVWVKVAYLSFVARNYGDDVARKRFDEAARALSELAQIG